MGGGGGIPVPHYISICIVLASLAIVQQRRGLEGVCSTARVHIATPTDLQMSSYFGHAAVVPMVSALECCCTCIYLRGSSKIINKSHAN